MQDQKKRKKEIGWFDKWYQDLPASGAAGGAAATAARTGSGGAAGGGDVKVMSAQAAEACRLATLA